MLLIKYLLIAGSIGSFLAAGIVWGQDVFQGITASRPIEPRWKLGSRLLVLAWVLLGPVLERLHWLRAVDRLDTLPSAFAEAKGAANAGVDRNQRGARQVVNRHQTGGHQAGRAKDAEPDRAADQRRDAEADAEHPLQGPPGLHVG